MNITTYPIICGEKMTMPLWVLIVLALVIVPYCIYRNGYETGYRQGRDFEHDWLAMKDPECGVGASRYEHDVQGSCPCV